MGAAWRSPKDRDIDRVLPLIEGVKELGLETCMTLGMLTQQQADRLNTAGLDFYNHNLDTSPEHYEQIITTRTYEDRIRTIQHVQNSGIKVCCGGIIGLGENSDCCYDSMVFIFTHVFTCLRFSIGSAFTEPPPQGNKWMTSRIPRKLEYIEPQKFGLTSRLT